MSAYNLSFSSGDKISSIFKYLKIILKAFIFLTLNLLPLYNNHNHVCIDKQLWELEKYHQYRYGKQLTSPIGNIYKS